MYGIDRAKSLAEISRDGALLVNEYAKCLVS